MDRVLSVFSVFSMKYNAKRVSCRFSKYVYSSKDMIVCIMRVRRGGYKKQDPYHHTSQYDCPVGLFYDHAKEFSKNDTSRRRQGKASVSGREAYANGIAA